MLDGIIEEVVYWIKFFSLYLRVPTGNNDIIMPGDTLMRVFIEKAMDAQLVTIRVLFDLPRNASLASRAYCQIATANININAVIVSPARYLPITPEQPYNLVQKGAPLPWL